MFLIMVSGSAEPVGSVGYWERDWQGETVYELGWKVTADSFGASTDVTMVVHAYCADIAKPLGIAVHDHIIVARDGHASLKGLRLI